MRTLLETDIIRIMREEWDQKVQTLQEDAASVALNLDVDKDGNNEVIVSPELKIVHKDSKIRYTVDSVGHADVILRTPEGERFIIDKDTLEDEYEID